MNLADLRRFTIRKESRISFRLRNGLECVVTDQGVAQVPELKSAPDFNLEEELGFATEFVVESAGPAPADKKTAVKPRRLTRDELAGLVAASPAAAAVHDHDDE
jgi:hypothetical protein